MTINLLELYRGACLPASALGKIREVKAIIRALTELPVTDETYRIFGALAAALRENGKPIGDFDEVIAAIMLAGDGGIVTRDHHFTRVSGLIVRMYQESGRAGSSGRPATGPDHPASLSGALPERRPPSPIG
jgi:predicted nucleic acid-binding protein